MSTHGNGSGDTETLLTLDALAKLLPKAEAADRAALLEDTSREELVKLGAEVDSARVVTDCARLYPLAHEFWRGASEAQKRALTGFSPELLAVAVGEAIALRDLKAGTREVSQDDLTARDRLAQAEREAFHAGLGARDHARTVLKVVAGRDGAARDAVDAAAGTAEDSEALAAGMARLAALGREKLHARDPKVRARVRLARLDEAYLRALDAMAERVRAASQAATAPRTRAQAAQGKVDYEDGVNVHLLGEVIHVFEAAHDLDASIPRLVPIATRRLLGRAGRRAQQAPAGGGAGGSGGAGGAGG